MKKHSWLWFIGAVLLLVGVSAVFGTAAVPNAYAGDDPVTQLSLSVDAGNDTACTNTLTLGRHSVQPTVAAYVAACNTQDGGVGVLDTAKHVKIPADGLYDVWVTSDKRYICCKPAAAGAASTCKILKFREF